MSMDIFGMMAELAADGYECELRAYEADDDGHCWRAEINDDCAGWGRTPEEAWRKACDAWDKTPEKERYRVTADASQTRPQPQKPSTNVFEVPPSVGMEPIAIPPEPLISSANPLWGHPVCEPVKKELRDEHGNPIGTFTILPPT